MERFSSRLFWLLNERLLVLFTHCSPEKSLSYHSHSFFIRLVSDNRLHVVPCSAFESIFPVAHAVAAPLSRLKSHYATRNHLRPSDPTPADAFPLSSFPRGTDSAAWFPPPSETRHHRRPLGVHTACDILRLTATVLFHQLATKSPGHRPCHRNLLTNQ
jgi:hypothetical protein